MNFHICGQELAIISSMLPYVNLGVFYVCQACGQISKKLRGTVGGTICKSDLGGVPQAIDAMQGQQFTDIEQGGVAAGRHLQY